MKLMIGAACLLLPTCAAAPVFAQDQASMPHMSQIEAAPAHASETMLTLPGNTEITVRMDEELSTRRNHEGDTFSLTVATDVVHNGYIVIPSGTRALGTITWLTKKGAFGKSGKMDIAINHVEVGSTRIPVVGTFRQEGEGNTVATVGAVVAVGIFGAFVTGRSGVIPAGRELQIHTRDPLRVAMPANAPRAEVLTATLAPSVTATAAAATEEAVSDTPAPAAAPASMPVSPTPSAESMQDEPTD